MVEQIEQALSKKLLVTRCIATSSKKLLVVNELFQFEDDVCTKGAHVACPTLVGVIASRFLCPF